MSRSRFDGCEGAWGGGVPDTVAVDHGVAEVQPAPDAGVEGLVLDLAERRVGAFGAGDLGAQGERRLLTEQSPDHLDRGRGAAA